MKLVIIESPYSGDTEINVDYARLCMADCLRRGEAPLASHLLYTQPGILRDDVSEERKLGIDAGLAWADKADATVVYTQEGWSDGMRYGVERAKKAGRPIEYRWVPGYVPKTKRGDDQIRFEGEQMADFPHSD